MYEKVSTLKIQYLVYNTCILCCFQFCNIFYAVITMLYLNSCYARKEKEEKNSYSQELRKFHFMVISKNHFQFKEEYSNNIFCKKALSFKSMHFYMHIFKTTWAILLLIFFFQLIKIQTIISNSYKYLTFMIINFLFVASSHNAQVPCLN